jgi:hypothetical protein
MEKKRKQKLAEEEAEEAARVLKEEEKADRLSDPSKKLVAGAESEDTTGSSIKSGEEKEVKENLLRWQESRQFKKDLEFVNVKRTEFENKYLFEDGIVAEEDLDETERIDQEVIALNLLRSMTASKFNCFKQVEVNSNLNVL